MIYKVIWEDGNGIFTTKLNEREFTKLRKLANFGHALILRVKVMDGPNE